MENSGFGTYGRIVALEQIVAMLLARSLPDQGSDEANLEDLKQSFIQLISDVSEEIIEEHGDVDALNHFRTGHTASLERMFNMAETFYPVFRGTQQR